ncbi:MAG: hypothetical protein KF688_10445 [Pirellulales bacterium]|nr:hypothetical protein [Pirellulales bacterium]
MTEPSLFFSAQRRLCRTMLAIGAGALLTAGCGSSGGSEHGDARIAASAACEAGEKAFEQGDFTTAEVELRKAVDSRLLNLDVYCSASVKLAVAEAAAGKFAEAAARLDDLERGAPNLDEVYAARAFLLGKQGNKAGAQAEFAKAKRLNPRIKAF